MTTNTASVLLPLATSSHWLERPLRIIVTPAKPPREGQDITWELLPPAQDCAAADRGAARGLG